MIKRTITVTLTLFILILIACGGKSENPSSNSKAPKKEIDKSKAKNEKPDGKRVYKKICATCHGADGKLGVSMATDLSTSTGDLDERIDQVTNGKGMMPPYKGILSAEEIEAVCIYIEELR